MAACITIRISNKKHKKAYFMIRRTKGKSKLSFVRTKIRKYCQKQTLNSGTNYQVTGTQLQDIFLYKMWNKFDYNHQKFYYYREKKWSESQRSQTQVRNRLTQSLFISTVQHKQRLYFTSNRKKLASSQTQHTSLRQTIEHLATDKALTPKTLYYPDD